MSVRKRKIAPLILSVVGPFLEHASGKLVAIGTAFVFWGVTPYKWSLFGGLLLLVGAVIGFREFRTDF